MPWETGDTVVLREIWREQIWTARPVTVVRDAEDLLMFYVTPGMRWMCPRRADGTWLRLPEDAWELGEREWDDTRALSFAWPDEAHAVLLMWDRNWNPRTWYVNLQEPLRRTMVGFDYMDQDLDALVALDGSSWTWKDEDELEEAIRRGIYTREQARAFRAEGERAVVRIRKREPPFDRDWTTWRPDPSWSVPSLPPDWDAL